MVDSSSISFLLFQNETLYLFDCNFHIFTNFTCTKVETTSLIWSNITFLLIQKKVHGPPFQCCTCQEHNLPIVSLFISIFRKTTKLDKSIYSIHHLLHSESKLLCFTGKNHTKVQIGSTLDLWLPSINAISTCPSNSTFLWSICSIKIHN